MIQLAWNLWGQKGEAVLDVDDCRLAIKDKNLSDRGYLLYALTADQAAKAKELFETTGNPGQDVHRFLATHKPELISPPVH